MCAVPDSGDATVRWGADNTRHTGPTGSAFGGQVFGRHRDERKSIVPHDARPEDIRDDRTSRNRDDVATAERFCRRALGVRLSRRQ